MADGKSTSMISDVADFEPTLAEKKEQYRRELMNKHQINRGSKHQPFSIEHMPYERTRLAKPMTAEDRFLRKQWVQDQVLHPSEPLQLEELWPRNIFRRAYMAPWNGIARLLGPQLGERNALRVRFAVPKLMMGFFSLYAFYYHIKYNSRNWEINGGWTWCSTKPRQFPDEEGYDPHKYEREPHQFYDQKFSERNALLNLKTSRSNYE